MASFTWTCVANHVTDTDRAWVTREGFNLKVSFNPNSGMTMAELITVIDNEINQRPARITRVTIKGQAFKRSVLGNYKAADYLPDKESFNCNMKSSACTIL